MYQWIARNIAEGMLSCEFRISSALGNGNITEDAPILLFKQESPVLYVACILNAKTTDLEAHQQFMSEYLSHLEKTLSDYFCSRIICLSIAVDDTRNEKTIEFMDKQEFIPTGISYHVWWNAILSEKSIIVGKGQPDKILHIRNIVLGALENPRQIEDISLRRLEKSVLDKATPIATTGKPYVTYGLILINGLLVVAMLLLNKSDEWINLFGASQIRVFGYGEYYRLITSAFLHAGITHFLSNSIYLYFFGGRTEMLFGRVKMLLLYLLACLGSGLFSVLFHNVLSVGASGGAFGLMGAVLLYSKMRGYRSIGMNYTSLLLWVVMGILIGFLTPGVDNLGHIGGFITGAVTAAIMLCVEKRNSPQQIGDK